jgi:ubiquinone biosynthesis protein
MIHPFGQFVRLLGIQRVLIRHGLDEIILATHFFRPLRFVLYLLPWNWFRRHTETRAIRMLHALEDLGPIFVKFGQLLSTRRDLIPEDIADAFAELQDRVPPFDSQIARRMIEQAFHRPLTELFAEFDDRPLASASIAQVHAARLHDGREIVVKVVRPSIRKVIERDIGLLHMLAEFAERYTQDGRRLKPTGVVREYHKIILDELDLNREAANASQLRRNLADSPHVHVPEVIWDLTHPNVLVMERITGIPVGDVAALRAAGINLRELAECGVELFFTQVFRDRFFHADMHPGNIFVTPATAVRPVHFSVVDFGIMGSLSDFDQHYLANNFLAFLHRDYQRVAKLHVESGWVPSDTRVDDFEFSIRTVCEPMFERPLKQISFGTLLLQLFQTAQRYHMKILPQLVLLQKTLVNIEGLGRQLYPDLNIWETARPIMERWMKERVGVQGAVRRTRQHLPEWGTALPQLPGLTQQVLEQLGSGQLRLQLGDTELRGLRREVRGLGLRLSLAVTGSGLLIGAAVILGLEGITPPLLAGAPLSVWLAGVAGVTLILTALFAD